ncbi:hypothetical protein HII36_07335 [Nonomuraea sp. NN258]|uniref:hypothetical protein n=1 Tax=Nonomuraea antri TaxID=2730852 RepID=UPI001567CD82|nr:hypothetical protein [Nonomuraea antri]NRQ31654.1 hypothetical protein [Nonomuraea antri]
MTIVLPLALRHRLPERVATHFTDGEPDNSEPLWAAVADALLMGTMAWTLLGLLAWLRPDGSVGRRSAAGLALGVVVLMDLSAVTGLVIANLDAEVWHEASSPAFTPVLVLGGAAVAAVLGGVFVSPWRRATDDPAEPPDDLDPGRPASGRTVWIGRARNTTYIWRTWIAACVMMIMFLAGMTWIIIPALLSLGAVLVRGDITAVFDGRTLKVRSALPFVWLRRINLAAVETAEAVQVNPPGLNRWGLRRHLIAVRPGEALLVGLRDGSEFVVTVDDAAAGAAEIRQALRREAGSSPRADDL